MYVKITLTLVGIYSIACSTAGFKAVQKRALLAIDCYSSRLVDDNLLLIAAL